MKIGFVGFGQMGKPMAINLLKCGKEVLVTDLRTELFPEMQAKGAKATTDLQDIAQCDLILLSLPDTKVVQAILLGDKGLLPSLRPGQIVADLSTINYTASTEIAQALEKKGVEFMDAPVSGMEARAIDGTLTVMCGGKKEIYEQLEPYFKCIGANILYMGVHGCGQLTKAINNILFDINIAAFAEILPMAVKLGLDPEAIGAVVNNSSGKSYASDFFIPRILRRHFGDGLRGLCPCGRTCAERNDVPWRGLHGRARTVYRAQPEGRLQRGRPPYRRGVHGALCGGVA